MKVTFLSLLLFLPSISGLCAHEPAENLAQPNILWIFIEDLSPWLGCYGNEINKEATPNIDAFAKTGVRFSRCFVPCPVCSPCRSAMITGAYQTTTGLHNHRSSRGPHDRIQLPDSVTTVPDLFKENGYWAFNIGKEDYNFDFDPKKLYAQPDLKGKNKGRPWNHDKTKPFFGQIQLKGGKANTSKLANKVNPSTVTPEPYYPNHKLFRKNYAHHHDTARVTDLDTQEILDKLKADGLLENTIIFWFTDHGNNVSLRAKQFCTEAGTHVPLIISGPHPALQADTTRHELTSLLDVSATSLALANIPIPAYFDGKNLFAENYENRDHIISARDRCDYTIDTVRSVRTDKFRYIRNFKTDRPLLQPQYRDNTPYVKFLRKGHQNGTLPKLTDEIFFGTKEEIRPPEELYEIGKDPHEINNLAKDPAYAAELQRHRDLLTEWIKTTGDKGQLPESDNGLKDVLRQWKHKCVNPEYDHLRKAAKQSAK